MNKNSTVRYDCDYLTSYAEEDYKIGKYDIIDT